MRFLVASNDKCERLNMNKLKLTFENCYGIRQLNKELTFEKKNVIAIYAPNGMMKTSFAKTFKDISQHSETSDKIYTSRITTRTVLDETDKEIEAENIFVIEPYNAEFKSDKVSTLLVNKELRTEYEQIYETIDSKKMLLLKILKKLSGNKKEAEVESLLAQDISNKKDFFTALNRVEKEVVDYTKNSKGLENIVYTSIFNEKSYDLLKDPSILENLSSYIETYDRLLESSTFFKKGVFNHNNASEIAKKLKDNGWFKANHSVNININGEEKKIATEDELEVAIKEEKEAILNDVKLNNAFDKLDKNLAKNQATKDFREYLEQHKEILPELKEPDAFKEKLWIAYLANSSGEYQSLLKLYEDSKERIQHIVNEADKQTTKWQEVIDEFNDRYDVPFKLKMVNKSDVILSDKVPSIQFEFNDSTEEIPVERELLLEVLSQGEKRALYILNIIFEVEARKNTHTQTLFIIDDIADSFDYKNKYAIIEYLNDISAVPYFYLILLTHNYDFHRNVCSRLSVVRENRFFASKAFDNILLEQEKYQRNPFNEWKKFTNPKYEIAALPFVRNLAEYCGNQDVFEKLSSVLHQKTQTSSIMMQDLPNLYGQVINIDACVNFSAPITVEQQIYNLADAICRDNKQYIELEDKVILSMAIRLKAEKFMIVNISKKQLLPDIKENQTYELSKLYKNLFSDQKLNISIIDKVNLMTPENIHINSFMYEPILDMSNEHLKKLYKQVSDLINE